MSTHSQLPGAVAPLANRRGEVYRINLSWLIKLRWAGITGQVVVIMVVAFGMHIALPLAPLAAIVGVEVATNIFRGALGDAATGAP